MNITIILKLLHYVCISYLVEIDNIGTKKAVAWYTTGYCVCYW